MPSGKGTYGKKKGRPAKKRKLPMSFLRNMKKKKKRKNK
jgi:hypothetical protein